MIFPQLQYRERNNSHGIPIAEWCDMVNAADEYCRNWSRRKQLVFRFWKIVRRFKYTSLPSFHPYWQSITREDDRTVCARLCDTYEICKEDPGQIKFYFNNNTTLQDIEKRINKLNKRIMKTRYRPDPSSLWNPSKLDTSHLPDTEPGRPMRSHPNKEKRMPLPKR